MIVWDAAAVLHLAEEDFPWLLPTYLAYPKLVQRSDIARYMILYRYGGVYLDADVSKGVHGCGVGCRKQSTSMVPQFVWYCDN